MNELELKTVEKMEKFGGSFVKSLAYAFHKADPVNFNKLKNAFPEYWKQYQDLKIKGKIKLPCLECGKMLEFDEDSNEAKGIFNVFCSGGECEDKFAFKQ